MKTHEIILASTSGAALLVSIVTAYFTFFRRFRGAIYVRPRIVLTCMNSRPVIVLGCEILNQGAQFGAIEDITLLLVNKNNIYNTSRNYIFNPTYLMKYFDVNKTYCDDDCEPFQSISVDKGCRLSWYILFCTDDPDFSPTAGNITLELHSRDSGRRSKWHRAFRTARQYSMDADTANTWKPCAGSKMLYANDSLSQRTLYVERLTH